LKPAYSIVGHVPDRVDAATLYDVAAILRRDGPSGKYDAIIVDDLSLLSDQTVSAIEKKCSGYDIWDRARDILLEIRTLSQQVGCHVIFNAHEMHPRETRGFSVPGGPQLPGRMPGDFPAACDIVLRGTYEPGRKPWGVVYRSGLDPNYITKDRHGVAPDPSPMNIGEILRAAGYKLRRAPGLDWQEEVVEKIATALLTHPIQAQGDLIGQSISAIKAKYTQNAMHIDWTIRDALDRSVIRRARQVDPAAKFR
jgi:hypothetical protein